MVKYILNWSGLSEQVANESKKNFPLLLIYNYKENSY